MLHVAFLSTFGMPLERTRMPVQPHAQRLGRFDDPVCSTLSPGILVKVTA